jgi:osmoprotectant transport system permease protein
MEWVVNNLPAISQHTLEHLAIALPPIVLSFFLSIPVGWAAWRFRPARGAVLTVASVLYALPSIPLLIVIPVLIGTGLQDPVNLVIALTLYGIALMARSTYDGLTSVDGDVRQSATAVGYSPWTRFTTVEFPLAGPVLLAGIRVVSVSTISLTTVGGVIGAPGLGLLFTDGFQTGNADEITTGIVLTVVIALLVDIVLVLVGRTLMPWIRVGRVTRRTRRAALRGPAVHA